MSVEKSSYACEHSPLGLYGHIKHCTNALGSPLVRAPERPGGKLSFGPHCPQERACWTFRSCENLLMQQSLQPPIRSATSFISQIQREEERIVGEFFQGKIQPRSPNVRLYQTLTN